MSDHGYQSLGLELGPFETSDLTLNAQANEAFNNILHLLPDEEREHFIQRAEKAVEQASKEASSGGHVDTEILTQRFSAILREILGSNPESTQ